MCLSTSHDCCDQEKVLVAMASGSRCGFSCSGDGNSASCSSDRHSSAQAAIVRIQSACIVGSAVNTAVWIVHIIMLFHVVVTSFCGTNIRLQNLRF
jgi:hypothetical protein